MTFRQNVTSWLNNEKYIVEFLLVFVAVLVSQSGWLSRVDLMLFDVGQHMTPWSVPDDIVIVAVDEDSLNRVGGWPWPRKTHAQLLRKLCAAKPAVIGFDIAFSEASSNLEDDATFASAIKECGQVVLPMVIETVGTRGQIIESPPMPELLKAAAGVGRAGVRLDEDGIMRSVYLKEGLGEASWPLFVEELLRVAGRRIEPVASEDASGNAFQISRHGLRMIEFVGPPGSIPSISYAALLEADFPPDFFENKRVLIGATAIGLGDSLPTPLSALAQPMSGVEVQANVLFSMDNGLLIRPLPVWQSTLICVLLALVPMLWLPRLMPLFGLLACIVWVVLLSLICALVPHLMHVWFSPAGALVAGMLAFPLWGWRRLESARKLLDNELLRLGSVLPGHSLMTRERKRKMKGMSFEQRIAWVQEAQQRMYELEEQRKETLAFISHDLRSPLASIVLQLEGSQVCDSAQVLPTLRRAQRMAQDFLLVARVEMLNTDQMREQELVSVLHQASDEVYEQMRSRGLKLVRQLPDDVVWVHGDFVAIERCTINLLQNAQTYAPENSVVTIGLDRDPRQERVSFWVENDGEAFGEEQMARLFQRFRRGEKGADNPNSTGLGLYYVHTVAQKHGGKAGVTCADGKIRFWVSLPVVTKQT